MQWAVLVFLQVESQESRHIWLEWHGCAMWLEPLRRQSRTVGQGCWIRRATWRKSRGARAHCGPLRRALAFVRASTRAITVTFGRQRPIFSLALSCCTRTWHTQVWPHCVGHSHFHIAGLLDHRVLGPHHTSLDGFARVFTNVVHNIHNLKSSSVRLLEIKNRLYKPHILRRAVDEKKSNAEKTLRTAPHTGAPDYRLQMGHQQEVIPCSNIRLIHLS